MEVPLTRFRASSKIWIDRCDGYMEVVVVVVAAVVVVVALVGGSLAITRAHVTTLVKRRGGRRDSQSRCYRRRPRRRRRHRHHGSDLCESWFSSHIFRRPSLTSFFPFQIPGCNLLIHYSFLLFTRAPFFFFALSQSPCKTVLIFSLSYAF